MRKKTAPAHGLVISIAQQKGGAGKTTLTAHLAIALQQAGLRVMSLDSDPQASLSSWYAERSRTLGGDTGIDHMPLSGWRLESETKRLKSQYDVVLIDSPPVNSSDSKAVMRAADIVLVPMQPSPLDLWASKPSLDYAAKEKSPVMLVFNRVPPRANLTDAVLELLQRWGVEPAASMIGNRTIMASAMLSGLTALEVEPKGKSAAEWRALASEIIALLRQQQAA